jgi:hypothetical protein
MSDNALPILSEILGLVRDLKQELKDHMFREEKTLQDIQDKLEITSDEVDKLKTAFPKNTDGERDYPGHKYFHQQDMTAEEDKKKFWTHIRNLVLGSAILSSFIWAGNILWQAFLQGPK